MSPSVKPTPRISTVGFTGMKDKFWGPRGEGECMLLQNLLPEDSSRPSALRTRPGIAAEGATAAAGISGAFEWYNAVNSKRTLVVINTSGLVYTCEENTSQTFVQKITGANLAAATNGAITVSSVPVHIIEYNGSLVFSDGTNQPWTWDGTDNAGLTLLSNAPSSVVGKPTVYYGKLFFIKSDNTIVWSEENAANTGYEARGYNNTWSLSQTSGEPLTAILGTNEALYYWRHRQTGAITGSVTPDFTTSGTHDAISSTVGCGSARSVIHDGRRIFFTDPQRRPWMLRGGELVPLWKQLTGLFNLRSGVSFFDVWEVYATDWRGSGVYWGDVAGVVSPATDQILFWIAYGTGSGLPRYDTALAFDRETGTFHGLWTVDGAGTVLTAFCEATHWTTGTVPWMGFAVGTMNGDTALCSLQTTDLADRIDNTPTSIFPTYRVVGPPLGWDTSTRKRATELDIVHTTPISAGGTKRARVTARIATPEDTTSSATDQDTWVTSGPTYGGSAEVRTSFGVNAEGRWLAPDITFSGRDNLGSATFPVGFRLYGYDIRVRFLSEEHENF